MRYVLFPCISLVCGHMRTHCVRIEASIAMQCFWIFIQNLVNIYLYLYMYLIMHTVLDIYTCNVYTPKQITFIHICTHQQILYMWKLRDKTMGWGPDWSCHFDPSGGGELADIEPAVLMACTPQIKQQKTWLAGISTNLSRCISSWKWECSNMSC